MSTVLSRKLAAKNPEGGNWDMGVGESKFQKDIRRGNLDGALAAAYQIVQAGYPGAIWNDLQKIVNEDIGPANSRLVLDIAFLRDEFNKKAKAAATFNKTTPTKAAIVNPRCMEILYEAVTLAVQSPKFRGSDMGYHYFSLAGRTLLDDIYDKSKKTGWKLVKSLKDAYKKFLTPNIQFKDIASVAGALLWAEEGNYAIRLLRDLSKDSLTVP